MRPVLLGRWTKSILQLSRRPHSGPWHPSLRRPSISVTKSVAWTIGLGSSGCVAAVYISQLHDQKLSAADEDCRDEGDEVSDQEIRHEEGQSANYVAIDFVRVVWRLLYLTWLALPLLLSAHICLSEDETSRWRKYWADTLVHRLELAGPIFVKLGQWASTRMDLLPVDLCTTLAAQLLRSTTEHEWSFTDKVLRRAYGDDYRSQLMDVEFKPIGSGSCAQVYRARLVDSGMTVVVKVLHPDMKAKFERDIRVIRWMASALAIIWPRLRYMSVDDMVCEFSQLMQSQIDLRIEATNLVKFRSNFDSSGLVSGRPGLKISFPQPHTALCSHPDVLIETFEDGLHLSDLVCHRQINPNSRISHIKSSLMKQIAQLGVKMLMQMVFVDNLVHGDLHSGNILVKTEPELTLVILDAGITSSLDSTRLDRLRSLMRAIVRGDSLSVATSFLDICPNRCQDRDSFIADMTQLVEENLTFQPDRGGASRLVPTLNLASVDVTRLLGSFMSVLSKHSVQMDAHFTAIFCAMTVIEGLGRTLDPSLDLLAHAAAVLLDDPIDYAAIVRSATRRSFDMFT